jgi:hypothetical protein
MVAVVFVEECNGIAFNVMSFMYLETEPYETPPSQSLVVDKYGLLVE